MSKNIVILCDGTSNEVSSNRTNILRLFGALQRNRNQIVYYDPGVGTFGADNSASYYYRKGVEIWGLATGWGLDQNVKEAYRFLVEHYEHGNGAAQTKRDPDQIYLFGFSRGAYTARVLAGFIHAVGIIPKNNLNLLDYAYRAYKEIGQENKSSAADSAFAEVRLYERILRPKRPAIELLGLFDTVGSVIESGRYGPRLRTHAFTRKNPSVRHVRHALAIDERRTMFEPQLWIRKGEFRQNIFNAASAIAQDIKEVWFTGCHGDVGGGHPEQKSALAKIPLDWMIRESQALGLGYSTRTVNAVVLGRNKGGPYVSPNAHAEINPSMNLAWKLLEYVPRRKLRIDEEGNKQGAFWYVPRSRPRTIPEGALVHRSVEDRFNKDSGDKPTNLPGRFEVVD